MKKLQKSNCWKEAKRKSQIPKGWVEKKKNLYHLEKVREVSNLQKRIMKFFITSLTSAAFWLYALVKNLLSKFCEGQVQWVSNCC